jgi:photosystem II stability/assembly factor-like uncharacterized protein
MIKSRIYILSIAFLLAAAGMSVFILQKKQDRLAVAKLESKHLPYDHIFMMRSYPDEYFDIKAYKNALQQAGQMADMKNTSDASTAEWTLEGPANISGRINCIAVHPEDSDIIYVGNASGGIYKTTDGGASWFPVFDDQPYLAVAEIVFDPFDPETLFAATGDPNISGYPFIGDGIYKTTDGGQTWTQLGLSQQGIISRIILDTKNPDVIYAASMGIPFQQTGFRGLYKSINGGQSWSQVLFINSGGSIATSGVSDAGIIDMLMDPVNHQVLYAAGWNRLRNNSQTIVSGNAARIYKSVNGGTSWTMLGGGLPATSYSRIGLCMSQQNHNVIFAAYVNTSYELDAIYKTINAGVTWTQIPIGTLPYGVLGGFGWYFGEIRVNPWNDNEIWLLGVDLYKTSDGGNNWVMAGPGWYSYDFHADKHDLVFIDSLTLLCATDGGLYKSTDGGNTWLDIDNIPNAQFYRITVDWFNPGNYCGGTQDNGTIYGSSDSLNSWLRLYGGDGFQPLFDYNNAGLMYAEAQNGALYYHLNNIWQYFGYGLNNNDRRSWDMPLTMSSVNSNVLYTGTYRIYKVSSAPTGSWATISGDLTNGVNSTFHVITTVDESPLNTAYVYAGTSDGYVWRSLNSGTSWTNISAGLPVRYVTSVKASPNSMNTVFVAHSGYKDNDFIPHIHRSVNNGTAWTDISGDLPQLAINDILVLQGSGDYVLFAATDGGVYFTENAGANWDRVGANMPQVAVYDLDYDAYNNRIIAGTYGRSMMSVPVSELITITAGTEKPSVTRLKIYPNITSNILNIETGINKAVTIRITDANGKIIRIIETDQEKVTINVSNLRPGVYFVVMVSGRDSIVEKFVVGKS